MGIAGIATLPAHRGPCDDLPRPRGSISRSSSLFSSMTSPYPYQYPCPWVWPRAPGRDGPPEPKVFCANIDSRPTYVHFVLGGEGGELCRRKGTAIFRGVSYTQEEHELEIAYLRAPVERRGWGGKGGRGGILIDPIALN